MATSRGECLGWSREEWKSPEKAIVGIKSLIREVPDFPKKGINFRDVMPVFLVPNAVEAVVDLFVTYINDNFDTLEGIVGLDARGFMIGTMVALRLHQPFIPIRKKGKLPGKCVTVSSTKEYGADEIEMQVEAIKVGQKVVVIDDLLATSGTLVHSCELVEECGGVVLGCMVLSEIMELRGRSQLKHPFHSFIQYYPRGIN